MSYKIIVKFIVTVKFALNCQKVNHPMCVPFLINLINRLTFAYLGGLKHIFLRSRIYGNP